MSELDWEYRSFGSRGVWVYPSSRESEVQKQIAAGRTTYDDQPDWDFSELTPEPIADIEAFLSNFGSVSHEASVAFEWTTSFPLHEPTRSEKWNIASHGWKHVSFRDLIAKADDVRAPRGKSLLRQTALAGGATLDEYEELLTGASKKRPADVARLWHLCPTREKQRQVLAELYAWSKSNEDIDRMIQDIPNPVELGEQYLRLIFPNRGQESSEAREALKTLITPGAAHDTLPSGGSAKRSPEPDDVLFIRAMSFSLVTQLLNVREVLIEKGLEGTALGVSLRSLQIEEKDEFADLVQNIGFKRGSGYAPPHELAKEITGLLLNMTTRNVKAILDKAKHRK